ncbi:MAG: ATP-binding protein [Planctomycetes bacterium]|nr:ATP-binding protein [Planctomycetota bacterium]
MTTRIWAGLPAKKFSVTGSFGTQSARITHELGGRVWGRIFTPRPLPVELRHFLQQMMYVDAQRALGNNLEKGLWQTFYLSGRRREMLDRFGETFDMKVKEASYSPQGGILIDTEPYPLRLDDLGGGMRIAFRLLMAETIASGSALLLEEFDAYQYRTSLEKLVDALNDVAHALDVQIFLTTHSLETVYAFLESSKSADPDAVRVITLSRSSDGKLESHSLHSADASNLLAAGLDLRYSPTPSR